jgi:hypothetical protein
MFKRGLYVSAILALLASSVEAKGTTCAALSNGIVPLENQTVGTLIHSRPNAPLPDYLLPPWDSPNDPIAKKPQAAPASEAGGGVAAPAKSPIEQLPPIGWLGLFLVAALSVGTMWVSCRLVLQNGSPEC